MRFGKRHAVHVSLATLLAATASTTAFADDAKDCQPGSWFCGETKPPSNDLEPLPSDRPAETKKSPEDRTPPPVVIYQPAPVHEAPPPYRYVPRHVQPRAEWGLNGHLGGAALPHGAGMMIGGPGLRFRPIPQAAAEFDLDFAGGTDYDGNHRREVAPTFNALVFANPRDRLQLYFVGGFGWSFANVDDRTSPTTTTGQNNYAYFGVQGGLGLELRVSRAIALNVDGRGYVRTRVDDRAQNQPEFTTSDGRTTNTAGGFIAQGGLTLYF